MGFFGNKKPSKQSSSFPENKSDIQEFTPVDSNIKFPEFPSYEDNASDLDFDSVKEQATEEPRAEDFMPREEVSIPQRKKMAPLQAMSQAVTPQSMQPQQMIPDVPKEAPQSGFSPASEYESSPYSQQSYSSPEITPSRAATYTSQKPLFVKIEDYKDAIYTIDKIKSKLKEADIVLEELSKIRRQEDAQLEDWKHDIENIKSKLLEIDKQIFGE